MDFFTAKPPRTPRLGRGRNDEVFEQKVAKESKTGEVEGSFEQKGGKAWEMDEDTSPGSAGERLISALAVYGAAGFNPAPHACFC